MLIKSFGFELRAILTRLLTAGQVRHQVPVKIKPCLPAPPLPSIRGRNRSFVTYAWTKIAGGSATKTSPASASTSITGLVAGA
jgi:hypothetical protein